MKAPTILIVDDDETITWTLASIIRKKHPDYKVYLATSGMEAFGYMKQLKNLDILITDIHMPGLSGIDLLRKIKDEKLKPEIIVITGFGTSEIYNEVERLGAIRYLTKPFDLATLVKIVDESLAFRENRKKHPGFIGSFGNLKMVDIIQINCLIQKKGLLEIKAGDRRGKLYFDAGNIIHAEAGLLAGEEAVYEVISWGSGDFHFREQVVPPKQTVRKSWEFILMETCRRQDRTDQKR